MGAGNGGTEADAVSSASSEHHSHASEINPSTWKAALTDRTGPGGVVVINAFRKIDHYEHVPKYLDARRARDIERVSSILGGACDLMSRRRLAIGVKRHAVFISGRGAPLERARWSSRRPASGESYRWER